MSESPNWPRSAVTWEARPTFGPYLRGLRTGARRTLRAAATDLGLSFSYLAKLETGERPRPPSLGLLQRMANVYGRDLREVMYEAGFHLTRAAIPAPEDLDAQFLRLVTDPRFRPARIEAVAVDVLGPLVKRQWIEFARNLERMLTGRTAEVDAVVSPAGSHQ